jgi:dienelactone hydrolase
MRIAGLRAVAALLLGLGLAACASTPPPQPEAQPEPRPAPMAALPAPVAPQPAPAAGPLSETESDIGRTFAAAIVALPVQDGGNEVLARIGSPELAQYMARAGQRSFATVLFLHGCDGLNNLVPLRALARRGFAVLAPDSFARRFRPLQCDPRSQTGGRNLYVFDFRAVEISYALHRMRRLAWVDAKRLFLLGVSEGGLAAAQYRGDDFRARVIAEWTCNGAALVRGLAAPADEPVLAVVRAADPWYNRAAARGLQAGDCGQYFGSRRRSRSLVLGGQGHDVLGDREGIAAILDFLSVEAERSGYRGS